MLRAVCQNGILLIFDLQFSQTDFIFRFNCVFFESVDLHPQFEITCAVEMGSLLRLQKELVKNMKHLTYLFQGITKGAFTE